MNSIADFMSKDHDRLEDIFKGFQKTKSSDVNKAKELFYSFKSGLERHIVWEEEILFPIFEERTGMSAGGPTMVMRTEHQQIKEFLTHINGQLANSDSGEAELIQVLTSHNDKEESILYPWIDNSLGENEREEILRRMKESDAKDDGIHNKSAEAKR